MIFRQATPHDLPTIYEILEGAIRRLGAMGVDQWQHGYPNRERIAQDVAEGVGYVIDEEDRVVAYGAVIFTGEEAYRAIEGRWLTDEENYVVVHRMCVAEEVVGHGFG
ncbi:MAG: GNAT family N-acetyltransferase, partial [Alistipes sp.]|nr:GNAT family N-acetyltransferase [Alistipes sp.]